MKLRKVIRSYNIEVCNECPHAVKANSIVGIVVGCKILRTMVAPDNIPKNCPLPDFICEIAEFTEVKC